MDTPPGGVVPFLFAFTLHNHININNLREHTSLGKRRNPEKNHKKP
jgi:hypothetical protein